VSSPNVERISGYRVLRSLGQTQLGRVYLSISTEERSRGAASRNDERGGPGFFCLELLHPDWARDDELRDLFLEEAEQTLQLEHPNVVRSQELLSDPEACGRVTRWFAGHSLSGLLERVGRAAFPLNLHVRVLCEVLAALQYLHELDDPTGASAGIVYRDASPERVFLTYTGQVKLLGAGFERTIDEIERRSGHLIADLGYASPELCLGYPASPSGDVYSVGVMLWEALARARRSFADTPQDCLRLRVSGEEPDVEQFRPGVPERLARICRRALAVSPRDRYESAQELQIDLESFLSDTETDAQQDAGLGALAQLMMQHFAPERAEMLTWIEQQLATLDPPEAALRTPGDAAAGELSSTLRFDVLPDAALSDDELGEDETVANVLADALLSAPLPAFALPPAVLQEGVLQEGVSQEGVSQEGVSQEGTSLEVISQPVISQPAISQPAASQPAISQPAVSQPAVSQPAVSQPAVSQPAVSPPAGSLEGVSQVAMLPPATLEPAFAELWDDHTHNVSSVEELPEAEREPPLPEVPLRDPETSGHRAYSSNLQQVLPRPSALSRIVVPIALAAGVFLLVTLSLRIMQLEPSPAKRASSAHDELARRAFARERREAAPGDGAARQVVAARALQPAVAPPSLPAPQSLSRPVAADAADAGAPEPTEPAMPILRADTLEPRVEARPAAKPRRARPRRPEARSEARAARPSGVLPRNIDETDPYLE